MAELGRGLLRIRTATIRKKEDKEDGSSVGEDVVRARLIFTARFYGFVWFCQNLV